MAKKVIIVRSPDGQRVPFLRGILVQSLTTAGLSFEDAYATAQRAREGLSAQDEIGTGDLRKQVAQLLEQDFGPEIRQRYLTAREQRQEIIVRTPTRDAPFSVGILSRYLEGCAIRRKQALGSARKVQTCLREQMLSTVDSRALRRIVYQTLLTEASSAAANRYLSRCHFEDSRTPLVILITGASGSGKSTVAAELAYRLEITRTQSTDIVREIVRNYLAPEAAATLGYSSFDAWRGMAPLPSGPPGTPGSPVIVGFLSQIRAIQGGLDATIARAVKECQYLILDGVHVIPSRLDLSWIQERAVLVPFTLAVTTPNRLSMQLNRRGTEQPERGNTRYQENLDAIWEIQRYLLDQAEQNEIPILLNWNVRETVRMMVRQVMHRISARFPPDPDALD